jgi:hypothetical protein
MGRVFDMVDKRRLITDIMFDPAYEGTIMRESLWLSIWMEDFKWSFLRSPLVAPLVEGFLRILGWFVKK